MNIEELPVSEVVVTGHPSISSYATSLQDTAQNVTVVPQELLTEQAASTVQDALKNVPGITLNAGEGGTHGDNINLRGFAASDDFFLDGLRDTGFYTRDSFNLEGIEVYKGPASTLFGSWAEAHFEHTDTIASPRASIVFKPIDIVSLYASYGTSYDPSAENLSLSAKTASLGPEKDKTFEVGAKSMLLGGRLALQAGVFQPK
jgi:outer membrane receptor for monomeric catechols